MERAACPWGMHRFRSKGRNNRTGQTRNLLEGSNPSLSAKRLIIYSIQRLYAFMLYPHTSVYIRNGGLMGE